jgi:hypothetical protein
MNKKEENKLLDQCIDYRLQIARLEKEIEKLEKDWVKENNEKEEIKEEFDIFKIMAHLRNNGVKQEMANILATDAYKMAKGDL